MNPRTKILECKTLVWAHIKRCIMPTLQDAAVFENAEKFAEALKELQRDLMHLDSLESYDAAERNVLGGVLEELKLCKAEYGLSCVEGCSDMLMREGER